MDVQFKEIIDLAVPMKSMDTPVYPGYPQPLRTIFSSIRDDGYAAYVWSFAEHTSTHVDAPVHMVAGGLPVDKMPLSNYVGRGVVLDFSGKPRYQIGKADIEKALKAAGRDKEVGKGWIMLFYCGYTAKGGTGEWLEHPDLTREACEYIISLGIVAVGMDASGPDHAPFEAHHTLLPKQVVIFENLNNVDKLLGKEFLFVGTPIALAGGTAGITRPIALVLQ